MRPIKDFSQTEDLAARCPQKVKEMKAGFIAEAKKYQVFPLDASVAARIVAPRPNITAGRTEFVYTRPMVGLPQGDSPMLLNASYTITADIDVPQGGAEGMILTSGGRFGGYGLYLLKGKPVWLWNMVDLERVKWEGPDPLTGVNDADYKPPFALTAKLNKLTIKVNRPQLSPEDIKKLQTAMREKAKRD